MIPRINRQVRLKSRSNGNPQAEHFEIATADVLEIADRQLLVRNEYLSIEPAMRGWVAAVANYSKPAASPTRSVRDGRLRYREGIEKGIESCLGAIAELYRGENLGRGVAAPSTS
jgi:NADPH-dependent curcumin reductase CurA